MKEFDKSAVERALDALPQTYRGPGGVAGVVKDGEVVAARAWGYSDLGAPRPMTTATRLPICSISKQFTCGVLLDKLPDFERLDSNVRDFLPEFTGTLPRIRDLCNNQSGLRDYWALTVLHGAEAEQTFAREDALPIIAKMKTGHFEPGTRYSYCNCNYRIVSELIERETGKTLQDLYKEVIWGPAGMETAVLTSDTRHPEDDVVGYEGSDATGFFPADNGIYWIGDAGISASLKDMLAYEAWIDATRDDPDSLYGRLSAPPSFSDGTPAAYGFGLAHETIGGVKVTGHAGALRGFRAHRMHAAAAQLSVVVIFNHESDAHAAASDVLKSALGQDATVPAPVSEDWEGQWICDDTGLLTRIETDRKGATLRFATFPDRLESGQNDSLSGPTVTVLRGQGGSEPTLSMTRTDENLSTTLKPLPAVTTGDGAEIAGRYEAGELDASMVIEARDGAVFARFEGLLGKGIMERMYPVGLDTWIVSTRRSMDAPAPGDWTFSVSRANDGTVDGATLGCWLARQIPYRKTA